MNLTTNRDSTITGQTQANRNLNQINSVHKSKKTPGKFILKVQFEGVAMSQCSQVEN